MMTPKGRQKVLPGELSAAERIGEDTMVDGQKLLPGELSQVEPVCGEETLTDGPSKQVLMPGELSQADPL